MTFINYCSNCKKNQVYISVNNFELCSKVSYFGMSFFGGVKFYSFRDILISIGIKQKAIIGRCENCNNLLIKCPYCNSKLNINVAKSEKCNKCNNLFYLCT